jgi:UDP-glucose/GDP-mannose dehydrogenase family protein
MNRQLYPGVTEVAFLLSRTNQEWKPGLISRSRILRSGSIPEARSTLEKIVKVVVAEAAKVENTQRDHNIALMNELALIFHRLGIDTKSVLEAAGTKWNFLKFSPGLVGGHA